MLIVRATARIAACLVGMGIAASAFAITPSTMPKAERNGQAPKTLKAEKSKRRDKDVHQRIQTYNLFHDPVFKLKGAIPDRRLPNTAPSSITPKTFGTPPASPLLKLQEPESSSIAFGCRDKAQPTAQTVAGVRELTACYKHNVDRAWKAHTYVSREMAEGNQRWGGGLALRYAY